MSGHATTPMETWECRFCGLARDVPAKNKGPGIPACGQCGKPMIRQQPPLTTSAEPVTASSAPAAPLYLEAHFQDPDTVMEPDHDGEDWRL